MSSKGLGIYLLTKRVTGGLRGVLSGIWGLFGLVLLLLVGVGGDNVDFDQIK